MKWFYGAKTFSTALCRKCPPCVWLCVKLCLSLHQQKLCRVLRCSKLTCRWGIKFWFSPTSSTSFCLVTFLRLQISAAVFRRKWNPVLPIRFLMRKGAASNAPRRQAVETDANLPRLMTFELARSCRQTGVLISDIFSIHRCFTPPPGILMNVLLIINWMATPFS